MLLLHKTESGYVARTDKGNQLVLHFNNVSLCFTPRSLRRLQQHLQALDLDQGMFSPEEKCHEVAFSTFPITLHFDYYEIHEFMELVEEGLSQFDLERILGEVGVSWAEPGGEANHDY
jgi:hypothetical protein